MQTNTCEEVIFRSANFDIYSQQQLISTLVKWLKQHKKNRKESVWNSLTFSLAALLMPDVQMSQLLISQQFFFDKVFHLLGLGTFRTQTLFNGTQIKLGQAFIAFDTTCKLQKVILEGAQIKQVSPTESFTLIKRQDLTCEDRKQKLFIYNRQQNKSTNFLTLELKLLERTKNQLFKEDHLNKMKFFTDFVFGEYCPSFCISGINLIEIKENQWLKEKTYLQSKSIFVIYSGTFVGFIQNVEQPNDGNQQNESKIKEMKPPRAMSASKSRKTPSTAQRRSHAQDYISKIQLNKGSIIESTSFQQILARTNQIPTYSFQSCKAICNSVIFQIKSSQFYRAIFTDERCMQYFMNQYQKVLFSRKLIFSQSLSTLNKFFALNEIQTDSTPFQFGISRRKCYKGFRSERGPKVKSQFEEMQNFVTVGIYETMIQNKQKIVSLQKEYAERNKQSKQKGSFRYEDTKKLKQNYKRMKIKDFHIQKLVFRNSVSNIKGLDGFKNAKMRFGQVKGMFEDQIEEVQKMQESQCKGSMQVQQNKQNFASSIFGRKGAKLKSYSPQTINSSYFKQSLTYSKTCLNSKRFSLNQEISQDRLGQMSNYKQEQSTEPMRMSKSTIVMDFKVTNNLACMLQCLGEVNRWKKEGLKAGMGKEKEMVGIRKGKKVKTFVKHAKKVQNVHPSLNMTLKCFGI